jgi:hypothetical protein
MGHDLDRIAKTGCHESRSFAGPLDGRNQLLRLTAEVTGRGTD